MVIVIKECLIFAVIFGDGKSGCWVWSIDDFKNGQAYD